jgi:hypothetical protein
MSADRGDMHIRVIWVLPLCAVAEAMSADRGDMHIRVIWVLPGGGQQCTSLARARIGCLTARAYAQMGMLARRAGDNHRPVAAAALQYCGVVAAS